MTQDLHQRARQALEQGQRESLALFDEAIRKDPGNGELWLGKAHALELNGDHRGARIVARQLAVQAPSFLAAQALLAQLRMADGEADFTSHYDQAAARHPQNPNIPLARCEVLAGLDLTAEAADQAAEARKRFPDEPHFALLEAVYASAAGQWQRAEGIFAALPQQTPERWFHQARHCLRAAQADQADILLDRVLEGDRWDVGVWALKGIVWRLTDDPRADWLHQQTGLVQFRALEAGPELLAQSKEHLLELHRHAAMPLGQSLRGGTQTRGILFDRPEPVLNSLHGAILTTLETYSSDLPSEDPTHPLLRHRATSWQLKGSWSVRMSGGGDHHTAHIHPEGIISSALYLIVPDDAAQAGGQGWLELGRPPPDLGLDLPPLHSFAPRPGYLALFPSTLYHGTTPFTSNERMTVAFDVAAKPSLSGIDANPVPPTLLV